MVRPLLSTLVWLASAAVSSTALAADQPGTGSGGKSIANSFIIEGKSSQEVESLAKTIEAAGAKVVERFDSPFFHGLSVSGGPNEIDITALAAGFNVWPEEEMTLEVENEAVQQAVQNEKRFPHPDGLGQQHESREAKGALWPNSMTHVDKMHKAGFKGEGIKIAIVDTGVDYTHEALGGCFGKGCKVVSGENFVTDGKKGDPKDCYGHGTAVAGIVAGYSEAAQYVGVAPNATLMAYRIANCDLTSTSGASLKAWLQAAADGAHIIISSTGTQDNWAQNPISVAVARIAASGILCVNSAGNSVAKGAFNIVTPGAGRGVLSVSTFSEKYVGDNYASLGPTWDLDVKPSLGAPGMAVPILWMNNTYMTLDGSSYAAPFVAGVAALVADVLHGGKGALPAKLDADAIRSRLMSTAKPQRASTGSGLAPVVNQGGGLVDAWDAAHATTLVEPASLAFNDTEHRVPSLSLKITNTAKSEVTYQLSSLHAPTLNTIVVSLTGGDDPIGAERVEKATADVKISKDSLILGPGQSGTVEVTAADPTGFNTVKAPQPASESDDDDDYDYSMPQLLVWSGWIVVNGTDGTNLTVPFLGTAGSLRFLNGLWLPGPKLKIDGPSKDKPVVSANTDKFILNDPSQVQLPGLPGSIAQQDAGKNVSRILIGTYLPVGSPQVRFDIVPLSICAPSLNGSNGTENCVPSGNLTEFGGVKSMGQPLASPMYYVPRKTSGDDVTLRWDGSYKSGKDAVAGEVRYAPPGRYQLAVHVLAHFGDASNASDWQTDTTEEFSIAYEHNIAGKAAATP